MCNTVWGKVNFRLELYHYWLLECSSEERPLNEAQIFSGKKKAKSNIEGQDICFCNYVLTNWGCAPPMLSSTAFQVPRLSSWLHRVIASGFSGFQKLTGVFTVSDGLRGEGTRGWWETQGWRSLSTKRKERFWGWLRISWASPPCSCAGTCSAVPGEIGLSILRLFAS